MAQQVGSRRSLVVSLFLTITVAFGSLGVTLALGWGPKLGLDLAGGLSVVYKPATPASKADMQEVVTILTNRVNGLGVSGAEVNLQGKNVVVSVPGVTNARAVLAAVGQTAQLLFRPVLCETTPASKTAKTVTSIPACASNYAMTASNLAVNTSTGNPTNNIPVDPAYTNIATTAPQNDLAKNTVILPALGATKNAARYVLGPAQLTGKSVKSAIAQQNQIGQWVVNYTLTVSG